MRIHVFFFYSDACLTTDQKKNLKNIYDFSLTSNLVLFIIPMASSVCV